jgi:hypothetical protein
MRAIVIDENTRVEIAKLIKIAENNVVDIRHLRDQGKLKEGDGNPIGDNSEHVMFIDGGFKVVFSHEDQGQDFEGKKGLGICKHISVSVSNAHDLGLGVKFIESSIPAFEITDMIIQEFGFGPLYECIVWPEAVDDGVTAINVLEPVDGFPKVFIADITQNFILTLATEKNPKFGETLIENIDILRKNNANLSS